MDAEQPCVACLGTRVCWVCDGRGHTADQLETACHSCSGTRVCRYCLTVDLNAHEPRAPAPSERAARDRPER